MPKKRRRVLGRHIVADPAICHSKPTFVGTRIRVAQVLRQVAKGIPWDDIAAEWRGDVTKEAIAEAVSFAQRRLDYGNGMPPIDSEPSLTVRELNDCLRSLPSLSDDADAFAEDVRAIRAEFSGRAR